MKNWFPICKNNNGNPHNFEDGKCEHCGEPFLPPTTDQTLKELRRKIEELVKQVSDFEMIPKDLTLTSLQKATLAVQYHGYNECLNDVLAILDSIEEEK